jgi:hypothetical protein
MGWFARGPASCHSPTIFSYVVLVAAVLTR